MTSSSQVQTADAALRAAMRDAVERLLPERDRILAETAAEEQSLNKALHDLRHGQLSQLRAEHASETAVREAHINKLDALKPRKDEANIACAQGISLVWSKTDFLIECAEERVHTILESEGRRLADLVAPALSQVRELLAPELGAGADAYAASVTKLASQTAKGARAAPLPSELHTIERDYPPDSLGRLRAVTDLHFKEWEIPGLFRQASRRAERILAAIDNHLHDTPVTP